MLQNIGRRFLSNSSSSSTTQGKFQIKEKVLDVLEKKYGFNLVYADVKNNNWKRNLPVYSDKDLEIIVVSTEFEGIKKEKRLELMKDLLKEELKDREVKFYLLTPSKWYDSNQRGLKLDPNYSEASTGLSAEKLKQIAAQFYKKPEQSSTTNQ